MYDLSEIHDMLIANMDASSASKILSAIENKISDEVCKAYNQGFDEGKNEEQELARLGL